MNPYDAMVIAAQEHGAAMRRGDSDAANRAYERAMTAMDRVKASPDGGEGLLRQALEEPNASVVFLAATYLLPINEVDAKKVLLSLSESERDLVGFSAKMVLQEWAAGRIHILKK